MYPRGQAVVRQLNCQNPRILSRPLVAQSRAYLRPRTANPRRICPLQSRALRLPLHFRNVSSRPRAHFGNNDNISRNVLPPTLQSRFPTKTVIFLTVLGTALYFLVSVELEEIEQHNAFWHQNSYPWQFFKDKDDLDEWHQLYNQALAPGAGADEIVNTVVGRFETHANGWQTTRELARETAMPITHGCRFVVNPICEDYYAFGTAPGAGSQPWSYWSIFDGHAGTATAHQLQMSMHPFLSDALYKLPPHAASSAIHATIKSVFTNIDNHLMTRARNAANWFPAAGASGFMQLAPAFSGSCALVAAFDPEKNKLHVACTGDSRAVLGRWDEFEGKYVAQPLSVDQTGFNESEVARIKAEHPDEPEILDPTTGRLLGLAVTRAFGDHRWKWPNDLVKACQLKWWGSSPREHNATPPYLTAEPEVTETDIIRAADSPSPPNSRPKTRSDFMIMASDGLWDHMSSDVAVACISQWLDARARSPTGLLPINSSSPQTNPPPPPSLIPTSLDPGVTFSIDDAQEVTWQAEPQYFAFEDNNAAVCLVRNAMGGTRRGLFAGLLTMPPSRMRNAVDDTTVMVVFFDDVGGEEGKGPVEAKKRWWWPF